MFLEHPDITRMNRYGTLSRETENEFVCPVCGEECEKYYILDGDIVGCDMCIDEVDVTNDETSDICPICGSEYERLHTIDGVVIGCDRCIENVAKYSLRLLDLMRK